MITQQRSSRSIRGNTTVLPKKDRGIKKYIEECDNDRDIIHTIVLARSQAFTDILNRTITREFDAKKCERIRWALLMNGIIPMNDNLAMFIHEYRSSIDDLLQMN